MNQSMSGQTPMPSSMPGEDPSEQMAETSEASEFHSSDPALIEGVAVGDVIEVKASLKVSAVTPDGADFEVSSIERNGPGPMRDTSGPSAKAAMDSYFAGSSVGSAE